MTGMSISGNVIGKFHWQRSYNQCTGHDNPHIVDSRPLSRSLVIIYEFYSAYTYMCCTYNSVSIHYALDLFKNNRLLDLDLLAPQWFSHCFGAQ